jgi:hypothetical protein
VERGGGGTLVDVALVAHELLVHAGGVMRHGVETRTDSWERSWRAVE